MFYTLTLFNKASDTISHSFLVITLVKHGLALKVGGRSPGPQISKNCGDCLVHLNVSNLWPSGIDIGTSTV